MTHRYIFGPVPSRRLGRSLGIDLLARKTCQLDCVYCECGPTEELVTGRLEYVPTQAVLDELDAALADRPPLESITFSGSGEPCLHLHVGKIINYIKDNYPQYTVTVLTNGTLLSDPAVRAELLRADRVVPSLDAVSEEVFVAVNRPAPGLVNAEIIEGLIKFREEYSGQLWLEIFIVPGLNDTPDELARLAATAARIRPERVQINSLDRPPAYSGIEAPTPERLQEIAAFFPGSEIVARQFVPVPVAAVRPDRIEAVLETLRRRPLTQEDLQVQLQMHVHEAHKLIQHLVETGRVQRSGDFYVISK
ncbi:MAG: radical SAM protein [Deltaproteobacteria bacterium HGW-Deltaproteobacteria-22]|jgi:wyosine [tRNA(Phe)-imidazoG37] synthetase (radical SAM superfamily)|nr:MAG: radical SAM protein [Deltaproteobacteria bacterium HGW-Deltaproteobacteria-22]